MKERKYLLSSQKWLEKTWRTLSEKGRAHQPLYGFLHRHLYTPGTTERYVVTYRLVKVLSSLRFRSLLDVGGGEGYRAGLIRKIFGTKRVVVADLSLEACRRARKFFSLPCVVMEAHSLPFKSESFDIVLSTETLEHIMEPESVVREMVRVARKAVVVVVNRKPSSLVRKYPKKFPYDVSSFDRKSFGFLEKEGYHLLSLGMVSPLTRFLGLLLDAQPRRHSRFWSFPPFLTSLYNRLCPFLRRMGREDFLYPILWLDPFFTRLMGYRTILFLLLKKGKRGEEKKFHPSIVTGFKLEREDASP
ncbi:MAG: class I SAM-dependent methyltransferase [Candidatus Hadarchaeales archaeon]